MSIRASARSATLKRKQKGSEDEWITGGPVTMNGNSSEILYLLDPAQGLCMPEGNTSRRVIGELHEETRSRRPIRATHHVSQATSEIPSFFSFELSRLEYVLSTGTRETNRRRWEVGRLHSTVEAG